MLCNHFDKYALCFDRDLNGGCMSRLGRMPVEYNASYLAEDLVKQSDKQSADETCAKSLICPEHDSLRNNWIMCIVSFCSSKRVVEAVVTKLLASVRICIAKHAALNSLHRPRRN